MIDFHSHILPGIDDGSRSLEESLQMLRMEAEQGITHVVATPHFYPRHDDPEKFLARRAKSAMALYRALERYPELPRFSLGAEVYFYRGMSDSDLLDRLRIGKGNCILVEMPVASWEPSMYAELARIREKRGLTPIVAHVDRYIAPLRTHGIPRKLEELPVLVQANASFFTERSTASMALKMLRAGQIHLIGSDCHNTDTRSPNMAPALERISRKLGREALDALEANSRRALKP